MNLSSKCSTQSKGKTAAAVFLLIVIISGLLVLSAGCSTVRVIPAREFDVMRVAHRGGAALAPENTLAAFAAGLAYDAAALEMDIHLSRDGVIMVTHDADIERVTGRKGLVSDFSADELTGMDASISFSGLKSSSANRPGSGGALSADKLRIPTLVEVLDFVSLHADRQILLQIEIKVKHDGSRYAGIEEKLIRLLHERGIIDSVVVISFDFPTLVELRKLEPDLKLGALISRGYMSGIGTGGPSAVADEMKALGVNYVGINYRYLSKTLYEVLRSRGLGIGVWTVNDPKVMRRFADMGVDFITTDRPDILREVLEPVGNQ
jgi:glycerophosphoryl diester phosphodiesterase